MADRRLPLLAAVLANAVPVVGVFAFGWSLAALLVLYWIELGIGLGFAAMRALFAQRPPEHDPRLLVIGAFRHRRWRVTFPGTSLKVQVANVPVLALVVPAFALIWVVVGTIGLAGVEQATTGEFFGQEAALTTVIGVPGILIGRGAETYAYFREGGYESASVQRAILTAGWPIAIVGTAMMGTGLAATAGIPPSVVLVAVVTTKLAFDLADVYGDRLVAFDERDGIDFGWASEPAEWPTVDVELRPPVETVRPVRRAVVIDGIVRGLSTPTTGFGAIVVVGVTVIGVLDDTFSLVGAGIALGGGLIAVAVTVGVLDRLVRYLPMEYRIGDDVVGYDRLAGRGQWRVPHWALSRCETRQTVADRLFGTRTLVVEHDDRTLRVAHVPETALPERIRE